MRKSSIVAAVVALAGIVAFAEDESREAPKITAAQIYEANYKGSQFYDENRYEEAYPYLMVAAQHGMKQAQAKIAYMHLNGLGGAERDAAMGIGWLGVAAAKPTEPRIQKYYDEKWKQIPKEHKAQFRKIIAAFEANYGAQAHGMRCKYERVTGSSVKRLACRYSDTRYGDILEDPYSTLEAGLEEATGGLGGGGGGGGAPF